MWRQHATGLVFCHRRFDGLAHVAQRPSAVFYGPPSRGRLGYTFYQAPGRGRLGYTFYQAPGRGRLGYTWPSQAVKTSWTEHQSRVRLLQGSMGGRVHRGLGGSIIATGKPALAHATLGIVRHPF